MAVNFKISVYISDENIHLRLSGDFDESSAYELINTLDRHCRRNSRVFIHTNCLEQIDPFGRDTLQSHLVGLNGECLPPIFTGDNAYRLAPKGSKLY
jgi:hypothetical protein